MGLDIVFDQDMDDSVLPAVGTFTVTSDGVPLVCTPTVWSTVRKLSIMTTGTPPVVNAFVKQNILDVNCFSALGTYARKQSDLQWFP